MDASSVTPFYEDWKFWSFVISGLAVILSQIPPLRILIRPKRLDVEVHSRINITHQIGNPNVSLHISLGNNGGRKLRIKGLKLNIQKDGKEIISLPAQNYFESQSDKTSVLFVPFTLMPDEYWSHTVNFLNLYDRPTEKSFREAATALKLDIQNKLRERSEHDKSEVIAEPELVKPFYDLFERLFIWEPGEYIFELTVDSHPSSSTFKKKYRFTLFESDTKDLTEHKKDYKFGGGPIVTVNSHIGLFIAISEHYGE
ncbi:MAG: hypothetical protein ACRCYN_06040 [Plesiomonas sp.]